MMGEDSHGRSQGVNSIARCFGESEESDKLYRMNEGLIILPWLLSPRSLEDEARKTANKLQ